MVKRKKRKGYSIITPGNTLELFKTKKQASKALGYYKKKFGNVWVNKI
jgi:hypothetical protein